MKLEQRAILELRAKDRRLEGYAAKFNTEARVGDFIELIAGGAFAASLKSGRDVLAMVDHDPSKVLARTKSGHLKLAEDSAGLAFELQVPDTTAGRDALALAERGDLGGMSFGFLPAKGGEQWDGNRRTLTAIDLYEISVVNGWPAYEGTTVNARSRAPRLALARRYLETCR
ncbi:MAG: primosome assembly protein PriA [Betaproteobacteria bacterium RIFCSPLOWO2_12_FULL_65_14]|nr:MAG: primosome assembly protein PriA [Betaproteobacteria bacterium RIFCSPLOWO2_12_FULL_65_14]